MATSFEEVIAGSANVYIAPVGTAFPSLDTALPTGAWVLMGSNGDLNTDGDDGITLTASVETEEFVPLGDIQAVKTWLTGYDQRVSFMLADISLEMLSHAYGGPATLAGNVSTTAAGSGTMGYKSLSLNRSGIPTQIALLVRMTQSPYAGATNQVMQFELRRVSQIAEVPLQIQKGIPIKVAYEYKVYRDPAGVGQIRAGNAAPL